MVAGCTGMESGAQYRLVPAFPNLEFERPLDFQVTGSDSRAFVVEQRGLISVFDNDINTESKTVYLDIRDRVDDGSNEMGLLGLAFHPNFSQNGYFYVNYTTGQPRRTVIARFEQADESAADPSSEVRLLEVRQPFGNHNGGGIAFGPDGFLYIGLGDGGAGGDPNEDGQDPTTLLGSILRIDVNNVTDSRTYSIPEDNPFVGNENNYREEIYAYGLRNPWRFSFDNETNELWVGDVGQNAYEEVDIVELGGNYGWDEREGAHCFEPKTGCQVDGLIDPVFEYSHRSGNSSVTGGYVYRGEALPGLAGKYVYGDFVSGRIWSLHRDGDGEWVNEQLVRARFGVASFGVDHQDNLFICGFDGRIYSLVKA